jgi:predicted membrane channel-forming protein YqfA (hemolysin III family)
MRERITFIFVALAVASVSMKLHLNSVGLAILAGITIPVVKMIFHSDDAAPSTHGYVFSMIGFAMLALAYLACLYHGISFEMLETDKSFSRFARRLPYAGIAFITYGATLAALSIFRQQRR